jgi:hypothetical protein
MKSRSLTAVLGVLLLTSSIVVGAADFTVSIPESIETPEKTVTIEGDSYTISSIARVEKGTMLSVDTSGPNDEEYRVYVHGAEDGSRQVQDTKFVAADDDGSVSFDTSEFSPGSYSVSIYHADTGKYYSPHPVVVPAFETSVTTPGTVTSDRSFEVNVSTDRIETGPSISSVELVFMQDETVNRVEATKSDGEYTATVTLSKTGDWEMYAAVRGTEDAPQGGKELIGISDPVEVAVESQTTTTTTTTSTSGGGGGDAGSDTTETTKSTTESSTATTTPSTSTDRDSSTTSTTSETSTATTTETSTTTAVQSTSPTASMTTAPPSTSEVIEPNTTENTGTSNGEAGSVPLALLALLASAVLLLRET